MIESADYYLQVAHTHLDEAKDQLVLGDMKLTELNVLVARAYMEMAEKVDQFALVSVPVP